ncbi:glycosyltransferase family A protein [uncultured Croceicoccus sp.]|uniref:glycosyltransferase family 2 protein n=1 Tax=uncultured Croceicoccus sp. TaxID=1295329 RepID=UPI00260EDDB8|nr:glycosyltransferase family A protein [uncultured Croceicoccus sp.]
MTLPRMSVVMPVYNVEAYVEEAIRSVLDQSFTDFELIVVDDGGNDNSLTLVRGFDDPRIRIVSQPNRGLPGARNTGIANARAPYVALLDSDDRWNREKLMLHYIHLEANPDVGVSFSGSRLIDCNGNVLRVAMKPKLNAITARDILCRNPVGNGSAPVIRRSALDAVAFPHPTEAGRTCWFDESFRQSEDIELWVRMIARHGIRFDGIAGQLTDYRIIGGALSANVVQQYASWARMMDALRGTAPDLVAQFGDTARAYQLRYLARRCVQLGNGTLGHDFMRRAIRSDRRILVQEPIKSLTTWAAVHVARLAGPDRFRAIARPYMKAAA